MFHRNSAGEREDGMGWREEGTGDSVMACVLGYAPDIYQLIQSCHASGSKMDTWQGVMVCPRPHTKLWERQDMIPKPMPLTPASQ